MSVISSSLKPSTDHAPPLPGGRWLKGSDAPKPKYFDQSLVAARTQDGRWLYERVTGDRLVCGWLIFHKLKWEDVWFLPLDKADGPSEPTP